MPASVFNLSSLDGTNGFKIKGEAAGFGSGRVASAGDVNGDGFDDVIIGAHRASPNNLSYSGSSFVLFGTNTRPTATITLSASALTMGETATVTFTFSEAVAGFDADDITLSNGVLSGLTMKNNKVWTATYTPDGDVTEAANVISVDMTGVKDRSDAYGTASSANFTIDTQRPTGRYADRRRGAG